MVAEPVSLGCLDCPVPKVIGQSQLRTALGFQHSWFLQPPVATWALGINTDPSCSGITDLDMVLCRGLGPDVAMAPGGSVGHSDRHAPSSSVVLEYQHVPR